MLKNWFTKALLMLNNIQREAFNHIPGHDKNRADKPSAEGTNWYPGIIMIVDHRANLGVWRVYHDHGRLYF